MELKTISLDKLIPNPSQPREGFDKESIRELAESFKSRGEIQPIIVRKKDAGYQIICGERRWRAADYAELNEIPVLIRDTAEEDVLLESLIENLHRQDLKSPERESAVLELWETGRWETRAALADELGKSEYWVGRNIIAAKKRKEEKIPATISTRTIHDLSGIEKEERGAIIDRIDEGEIPVEEVREYRAAVQTLPELVKERVIKSESRVTPKVGEKITKLPEDIWEPTIERIEAERMTEDEAISEIEKAKMEIEIAPEKAEVEPPEVMRARWEKLKDEIERITEKPEVKKRGKLFRNWHAHYLIKEAARNAYCPSHPDGSGKLIWSCCKKEIEESEKEAGDLYESSTRED